MLKLSRHLSSTEESPDLNIMPVLDILSTLVVFLLLSAVWFQAGWFPVMGSGTPSHSQDKPKVSVAISHQGPQRWEMKLQGPQGLMASYNNLNAEQLKSLLAEIKKKQDVQQAFVFPHAKQPYQEVVQVIDLLNSQSITQVQLQSAKRGVL
jgi:biopolymer transport protein ExbD